MSNKGVLSSPLFEELAIVVLTSDHNPTILNHDFLVGNEIIPSDWKLTADPVITRAFSQIVYSKVAHCCRSGMASVLRQRALG